MSLTIRVRNTGNDNARVRVSVSRVPECSDIGGRLGSQDGRIPAGGTSTWHFESYAPYETRWYLMVNAELLPVSQSVLKYEATVHNNNAGIRIGPWPFRKCFAG
jgi:hypothetical protein